MAAPREPDPTEPRPATARTFGQPQCEPCRQELGDGPLINEWLITTRQRSMLLQRVHTVEATCARCRSVLNFNTRNATVLGNILAKVMNAALALFENRTATGAPAAPEPARNTERRASA